MSDHLSPMETYHRGTVYILSSLLESLFPSFPFLSFHHSPSSLTHYRFFQTVEDALIASGTFDTVMFQPTGPAGIFALYATAGSSLGLILINEFVVVSYSVSFQSRFLFGALSMSSDYMYFVFARVLDSRLLLTYRIS